MLYRKIDPSLADATRILVTRYMKQMLLESLPVRGDVVSVTTVDRSVLLEGPPPLCLDIPSQTINRARISYVGITPVGEGIDLRNGEVLCIQLETREPFANDIITKAYLIQQGMDVNMPTVLAYRKGWALAWDCPFTLTRFQSETVAESYVCLVGEHGVIHSCLARVEGYSRSLVDRIASTVAKGSSLTYDGPLQIQTMAREELGMYFDEHGCVDSPLSFFAA